MIPLIHVLLTTHSKLLDNFSNLLFESRWMKVMIL